MVTYSTVAIITDVGLQAALNAEAVSGPRININSFQIGANAGYVPLSSDTGVSSPVFTMTNANQLTYIIGIDHQVIYRVILDESIGNFQIGNIGLFLDTGQMFAECVLPAPTTKIQVNAPITPGNFRVFDILISFANIGDLVTFSIDSAYPASLPIVSTQLSLPAPASAPFALYLVEENSTLNNQPTLAYTDGVRWWYSVVNTSNFQLYSENFFSGISPSINVTAYNGVGIGHGATIQGSGQRTVVLGFSNTEGTDSFVAAIGSNSAAQKSTGNNLIVAGYYNQGGTSLSHQFNLCIGGSNNLVQAIAAAIVGGQNHIASANLSSILGGSYGITTILGQRSFAVGRFTNNGDAQSSSFMLRTFTTNNTPTEMLINGTDRMVLRDNETWGFRAKIIARRTDAANESGYILVEGAIDRQVGVATTALVDTTVGVNRIAYDDLDWTVQASADNVNGSLKLTVTGEVGKVIRWVALVDVVQVTN